jgi:hypothetical protein
MECKFLPLLEEALERNRILRIMDYKDHINKVTETRLNIDWRKLIKENRECKRRIQGIVKEINYGRIEVEREQTEFQEIMGLFGEKAYSQQGENPIAVMDVIFETWEDIEDQDSNSSK